MTPSTPTWSWPGTIGLAALLLVAAGGCQRTPPPPAADCGPVADALVSLEVGNYATAEERAAKRPAKLALCARHRITVEELACLAKARATWDAATCVPRMFPPRPAGECAPVIAKIRAAIADGPGRDLTLQPMVDRALTVMRQSCAEDGWPDEFRRCILDTPVGDIKAFSACEQAAPPALKAKLEQRMRDVMK